MAYSNLFMTKRDSIQNIPKELVTTEKDTDAFLHRSECSLDQNKSSICSSIPELDEHEDREVVSSGTEIKSDVKNKNSSWREKLQSKFRMQQNQKQKVSSKNKLRRGAKRASMKGVHKRKLAPVIFLDFAGQEVFYSTHQSFLTHRGVYVIVINGSLMLDDEIVTETFIPGRQGKPTTRGYVKFWISSILSYAKGRSQSFPRIIVCCTHKDKIPKEKVETQRKYIFDEIENMFEGSPSSPHLVLKDRIFLNALDRTDPELEVLKDVIVEMMYKQPTWGEKMPKAWIQLEMEIHDVAKEGTQIITLEQLGKMNQKNPVKSLGEEEINLFLQVHHSLGNIIHFPFIGLREYILISPSFLIDALRCIVTDRQFCKAERLKSWTDLSNLGVLRKYDVLKIMQKHKEFKRHQDFLINLMCHLDILVEPRNYLKDGQYDSSEIYFVPCMITKQYIGTQFFQQENTKDKSINLSFKFNTTILPPAVGFRLIACCLHIWNAKTYSNKPLLCSGIVVVTINRSLCLTVRLKEQRIDIMLTHNTSRFNIISQVASSIRECLQDCLRGISNSYKASSFGTLDDHSEMFHTEFSCYDLNDPCYYKESKNWICSHGYNIEQDITNKWFSNKQSEDCRPDCKGVSIEALKQRPSDLHLAKLSSQITWSDLRTILVHLGLEERERLTIEEDYPGHNVNIRFLCLRKWNKKSLNPTLEDIQKALLHENQNPHVLCHMFRDSNMKTNLSPTRMETEPTDLDIDKIATHAIEESLMLCVNLSIDVNEWLQMKDSNGKIVDINRTILHKWKKEHPGKPKLKELAQALSNVSINIDYVLDNNAT